MKVNHIAAIIQEWMAQPSVSQNRFVRLALFQAEKPCMLSISQLVHKQLGTQTLGLLVEVEQERTEKRLAHILPLLLASLTVSEGEPDTRGPCKNPPVEVICFSRRRQREDVLK